MGLLSEFEHVLSPDQLDQLNKFLDLMPQARRLGLVGFPAAAEEEQLARSLVLLALLPPGSYVDVGPGAGFPGIPIGIARGSGLMVEPKRRAVGFLEKVVRELHLDGVQVVQARAEEFAAGAGWEAAQAVTARAVAPPARVAELCARLLAVGGVLVLTAAPGARLGPEELPPELTLEREETLQIGLELTQTVHIITKNAPSVRQPGGRPHR